MSLSMRIEIVGVALLLAACGGSEQAAIPPVEPVFIPMPSEDDMFGEDEDELEEAPPKAEGAPAAAEAETKPGAAAPAAAKPGQAAPATKPATGAAAKPATSPTPAPAPAAKPAPAPAKPAPAPAPAKKP